WLAFVSAERANNGSALWDKERVAERCASCCLGGTWMEGDCNGRHGDGPFARDGCREGSRTLRHEGGRSRMARPSRDGPRTDHARLAARLGSRQADGQQLAATT